VKRTKRRVQEGINEIKNIKSSEVPVAAVVVAAAAVVQAIATVGVVQAVAQVAQVAVAVQVQALAVVQRAVAAVVANLVIVKQPRRKSVKIKKSTDKRIGPKIKN